MIYGKLPLEEKEVYLPLETTLMRKRKDAVDLPLEKRTVYLPLV
jgi:hypothetical protein